MRKMLLVILAALCGAAWGTVGYLLMQPPRSSAVGGIPTLMVLPSVTPSPTATHTPTFTLTYTATVTPSPTETALPTLTPTLATRVVQIDALLPGTASTIAPTEYPFGTVLLYEPPQPSEPLPDATHAPPPYHGWVSFESDNPNLVYATRWEPRQVPEASRGQYHRTERVDTSVRFAFEGEGLRVRYVTARNMGLFQIVADGVVLDTIDAYAPELAYPVTRTYTLTRGAHLLELRPTGQKHAQSEGYVTALDAVQVYRADANTLIVTPSLDTPEPTATPHYAKSVELVAAPPTLQPTPSPAPPSVVRVSVIIAYDENGNRAVDPAEGVSGVSVRVVEAGTNRAIAHALTDTSGYARLEVVTPSQARVVVPYFSQVWDVSRGDDSFTLLIAPANQPGLIP